MVFSVSFFSLEGVRWIKQRIRSAFREEVRRQGLRFSMDDLATRLGVSKKTIYNYYSSKAEILDELINEDITSMELKATAIIENEKLSFVEKLKEVIKVIPDRHDLTDFRVLNEMQKYFPEQYAKFDGFLQSDWEKIRILIEEGITKGIIKDINIVIIMKVIIAAVNTTMDQSFYLENNVNPLEAMDHIATILLEGILEDK